MKEIAIAKIKLGNCFQNPVFFDQSGSSMFLAANTPVSVHDLNVLTNWKSQFVYSENDTVINEIEKTQNMVLDDEGLECVNETELTVEEPFSEILYKKWIYKLDAFFKSILQNNPIVARPLDALSQDIARCVSGGNADVMVQTVLNSEEFGTLLARNSINTAIFTSLISRDSGCQDIKLEPTITGALLHDVGMLFISKRITAQKGKLSPQDITEMQSHTIKGRNFAEKHLMYSSFIGNIIYQHHEHWQGGGYPCNIAGDKIQYESCIVAVADAFAAMVQDSAYRESLIGYDAVKELLNNNSSRFNPMILKYFIIRIGLYPPGSFVILSDSSIARVVDHHSDSPLRPVVQLWVKKDGMTYTSNEGPLVDLKQERSLFIVRVLNPKEYKAL